MLPLYYKPQKDTTKHDIYNNLCTLNIDLLYVISFWYFRSNIVNTSYYILVNLSCKHVKTKFSIKMILHDNVTVCEGNNYANLKYPEPHPSFNAKIPKLIQITKSQSRPYHSLITPVRNHRLLLHAGGLCVFI